MENATAMHVHGGTSARAERATVGSTTCCQMPLSYLRSGESAVIAKVRGRGDLHHHLETLGFVEGATVEVMSKAADDLIVQVKGTRVALGKQVAARILATTATPTPNPA